MPHFMIVLIRFFNNEMSVFEEYGTVNNIIANVANYVRSDQENRKLLT